MLREFFSEWRFPVVAVTLLTGAVMLMGAMLLVPPSTGSLHAFAEEFKRICFGYDATSDDMEWAYLWLFLVQPLLMAGLILVLWREPVVRAWRLRRGPVLRWAAATFAVTLLGGFALPAMSPAPAGAGPPAFPGEAIRTAVPAPGFELVDQEGASVQMEALRGRVVVVTAVYASCGDTCPLIVQQIKRAVNTLSEEEREELTVVAVTMDPVKDTPAMLAMMAEQFGVSAPTYRYATGEPETVEQVLDRYGFVRKRLSDGSIAHANLIHVIDRAGLIAFRFSLGDVQQAWLAEALRLTVGEGAA